MLIRARGDLLAYAIFPKEHWRDSWFNNPTPAQRRTLPPHRRRRDLLSPTGAIVRLSAVLAEQNDEWAEARRYMSSLSLTKAASA